MSMQPYYSLIDASVYDEQAGFHYFKFPWSLDMEEIKARHKAVYQAKLNKEFKEGVLEEWKSYILEHRAHVRELIGAQAEAALPQLNEGDAFAALASSRS